LKQALELKLVALASHVKPNAFLLEPELVREVWLLIFFFLCRLLHWHGHRLGYGHGHWRVLFITHDVYGWFISAAAGAVFFVDACLDS